MDDTHFFRQDFSYGASDAPGGVTASPVALSIFADRAHLRATLRDDARAAGLTITNVGVLSDLAEGQVRPLGDVVLVDCPHVDAHALAALARLDMRAARCEARLIVSTSVAALDEVFSCMDQSEPLLLVDPDRAERVIALGRALAEFPKGRLRELSGEDRVMLLRLAEQVSQLAGRMDRFVPLSSPDQATPASRSAVVSAAEAAGAGLATSVFRHSDNAAEAANRKARPSFPDVQMLRQIIRQRQQRARYLDGNLFADPAWDMLLDLAAARIEQKRVSVTSLCIASGVPPTTALRWIGQMVEAGLFVRVCDDSDRRRAFIELTEKAVDAVARYFDDISLRAPMPV